MTLQASSSAIRPPTRTSSISTLPPVLSSLVTMPSLMKHGIYNPVIPPRPSSCTILVLKQTPPLSTLTAHYTPHQLAQSHPSQYHGHPHPLTSCSPRSPHSLASLPCFPFAWLNNPTPSRLSQLEFTLRLPASLPLMT
jgi:hypothetical protein